MSIFFELKPVKPFRLDLTVWALRRRPDNTVDRWDGQNYRRILTVKGEPVEVTVTQPDLSGESDLYVTAVAKRHTPELESIFTKALNRLLGIQTDLSEFYRFARRDEQLRVFVQRFRGLKSPRFLTLFEALVNAIACQQLTLTVGILLLNRLTETFGRAFKGRDGLDYAFPAPEDLASLKPDTLRRLGFSYHKSQAVIDLARAVSYEGLDLEGLSALDDKKALRRLQLLRGVGRWTAEYVLLRGLGRIHIFPADDVGGRNKLQSLLNLKETLDYEGVHRILTRWKPYGGLIYFHLLLKSLDEEGYLL